MSLFLMFPPQPTNPLPPREHWIAKIILDGMVGGPHSICVLRSESSHNRETSFKDCLSLSTKPWIADFRPGWYQFCNLVKHWLHIPICPHLHMSDFLNVSFVVSADSCWGPLLVLHPGAGFLLVPAALCVCGCEEEGKSGGLVVMASPF